MDDKKFEIKDNQGNTIQCEIVKLVPNNEDEEKPYIIYTDFKNGLLCGMLIEEDGEYTINRIEEDYIVDYLKEELSDEIAKELEKYEEYAKNE